MRTEGLIGIEIKAGGRWKFVGKVGTCPMTRYRGARVLYRDVPWSDVYSWTTETVGVDREAWDVAANELGATAMIVFCKDESRLLMIDKKAFANAFILDLGELPQYRIPLEHVAQVDCNQAIPMGWTAKTVKIEPVIPPPLPAPTPEPTLFS